MVETKPINLRTTASGTVPSHQFGLVGHLPVRFTRQELQTILNVYGSNVAAGNWRDYAIDMGREKAIFSIFRRSSEVPIYRVEKNPKLGRKQGAFSVISATGLILKRGGDLPHVLSVIDRRIRLIEG